MVDGRCAIDSSSVTSCSMSRRDAHTPREVRCSRRPDEHPCVPLPEEQPPPPAVQEGRAACEMGKGVGGRRDRRGDELCHCTWASTRTARTPDAQTCLTQRNQGANLVPVWITRGQLKYLGQAAGNSFFRPGQKRTKMDGLCPFRSVVGDALICHI
jgi:hypothetical protein